MDSNKRIRRVLYVSAALLILSAIPLTSHDQEAAGMAMLVLGVILLWIATSKSLSGDDGESEPRKAPGQRQAAESAPTAEKESEVRCPVCGRVRDAADLEFAHRAHFGDVCLNCWAREAAGFYGHYRELLRRVLREHGIEPDPDRLGKLMAEPVTETGNYADWSGEDLLLYAVPAQGGEVAMSLSGEGGLCRIPIERNAGGKRLSGQRIDILAICASHGVLYMMNTEGGVYSEEQGTSGKFKPLFFAFSLAEEARRLIQPLPRLLENVGKYYEIQTDGSVCVLDVVDHYEYNFEKQCFLFVNWSELYSNDCPPITETPLTEEEFMRRLVRSDYRFNWFLFYMAARYDLKWIAGKNDKGVLLALQLVVAQPDDLPAPAPSASDGKTFMGGNLEELGLP